MKWSLSIIWNKNKSSKIRVIQNPPIETKLNQFALCAFEFLATDTQMKPNRFSTWNITSEQKLALIIYLTIPCDGTEQRCKFQLNRTNWPTFSVPGKLLTYEGSNLIVISTAVVVVDVYVLWVVGSADSGSILTSTSLNNSPISV